jgi:hypothetical protein
VTVLIAFGLFLLAAFIVDRVERRAGRNARIVQERTEQVPRINGVVAVEDPPGDGRSEIDDKRPAVP